MDVFWAAPPVSRTLAAAAFATSVLVYTSVLPGWWVVWLWPKIFTLPPQIWRFITPFLITSPKFGILMDPYFIYTYGSALERESVRLSQPGALAVYLVFVAIIIIVSHPSKIIPREPLRTSHICPYSFSISVTVPGNEEDYPCSSRWPVIRKVNQKGQRAEQAWWEYKFNEQIRRSCAFVVKWLPTLALSSQLLAATGYGCSLTSGTILNAFVMTPALVLALAYTYSQENPSRKITFFVVTFRVKWLPYVMLLMTLVSESPESALTQAGGLVAAHLYDFLTRLYPTFGGGRNYLQTPLFVSRWFEPANGRPVVVKPYGTAFNTGRTAPTSSRSGSSSFASNFGGVSNLWNRRGAGRRLGGD